MSKYVVRTKTDSTKGKKKVLYYGVPVASPQITLEKMAGFIQTSCSLTKGDVHSAIIAISQAMKEYLTAGHTVHLPGIGLFSISASSEGFETPQEVTPGKMKAKRICFKADNKLRSLLRDVKFNRID